MPSKTSQLADVRVDREECEALLQELEAGAVSVTREIDDPQKYAAARIELYRAGFISVEEDESEDILDDIAVIHMHDRSDTIKPDLFYSLGFYAVSRGDFQLAEKCLEYMEMFCVVDVDEYHFTYCYPQLMLRISEGMLDRDDGDHQAEESAKRRLVLVMDFLHRRSDYLLRRNWIDGSPMAVFNEGLYGLYYDAECVALKFRYDDLADSCRQSIQLDPNVIRKHFESDINRVRLMRAKADARYFGATGGSDINLASSAMQIAVDLRNRYGYERECLDILRMLNKYDPARLAYAGIAAATDSSRARFTVAQYLYFAEKKSNPMTELYAAVEHVAEDYDRSLQYGCYLQIWEAACELSLNRGADKAAFKEFLTMLMGRILKSEGVRGNNAGFRMKRLGLRAQCKAAIAEISVPSERRALLSEARRNAWKLARFDTTQPDIDEDTAISINYYANEALIAVVESFARLGDFGAAREMLTKDSNFPQVFDRKTHQDMFTRAANLVARIALAQENYVEAANFANMIKQGIAAKTDSRMSTNSSRLDYVELCSTIARRLRTELD